MKVLITGGNAGLGLAVMQLGETLGWKIRSESRQTGLDISSRADRQCLIERSLGFDAFINNAHHEFAQTELLFELHSHWLDMNKSGTIVNISSRAAKQFLARTKPARLYDHSKVSLSSLSQQLAMDSRIRTTCLHFGKLAEAESLEALSFSYAAQAIVWVLSQPQGVLVSEMTIQRL